MTKLITLALFIITLVGCQKTDPTPELRDEIYKDLQVELEIATKALEAEEKNLETLLKERQKAIPQTGQIKYANKKVYDSQERIEQIRQQKTYFEIKIETRKFEVRARYAESLKKGGRPWPDPKEVEMYKTVTEFYRNKINWEKTKGTKKNVPRGTKVESGAEKAAEPPPSH